MRFFELTIVAAFVVAWIILESVAKRYDKNEKSGEKTSGRTADIAPAEENEQP